MSLPAPSLTAADLEALPVFPLPDIALFPGALLPLHVFEPRYVDMTRDVLAGRRMMAVARLKPGYEGEYHGRPPIHAVCGVGTVVEDTERPDGRYDIVVEGIARMRIVHELAATHPYRRVQGLELRDGEPRDALALFGWQKQLVALVDEIADHLAARGVSAGEPFEAQGLRDLARGAENASALADRTAATLIADPDERQHLLEQLDPTARTGRMVELLHELLASLPGERKRPVSNLS